MKKLMIAGAALVAVAAASFVGLSQLPRLSSYREHQLRHILAAASVDDVTKMLGSRAREIRWTFELDDDDPFVCEVFLFWNAGEVRHSARWVVIHKVGLHGVQLDEVAALNVDAHNLTPRVAFRESVLGNLSTARLQPPR